MSSIALFCGNGVLWFHIDGYGFDCIGLTNNDSATECILAFSVTLDVPDYL